MPAYLARSILFLCSYFPLVAIYCILLVGTWPLWAVLLLLSAGLASLLLTALIFHQLRRANVAYRRKAVSVTRRNGDVMAYVASYIIPFVSFSLTNVQQALALGVFFVVLFVIYVHSNMIYVNPMLNLGGYHLYEVEIEGNDGPRMYIARGRLVRGDEIRFVALDNDICLQA